MDAFYFILRYTPFWTVPLLIISGEFAYVYWLKSYKTVSIICGILFSIGFLFLTFWIWSGGADKSVKVLQTFIRYVTA